MSWEDVTKLCDLSQVNMELAIVWLDDCIKYLQEEREYLEKSGRMLNACHDEVSHKAPGRNPEIPVRMQQGKQ